MRTIPFPPLSGIVRRRDERDRIRALIIQACELGRQTDMDEISRAGKLRTLKQSAQETLEQARESAAKDAGKSASCRSWDDGFRVGLEVAQRQPEDA